jgi:hypothetical protein
MSLEDSQKITQRLTPKRKIISNFLAITSRTQQTLHRETMTDWSETTISIPVKS